MTVSSVTRKVGPFIGNGSATIFAFPFKVFEAEDLLVVRLEVATGIETELRLDSDYTAALNFAQDATPGGSITLPAPLAVGFNLVISSDQPELQEADITNQGGFYPEVITAALDELIINVQQLKEQAERTLCYPISDPPLNATLPPAEQRAGTFLYFGTDGSIDLVTREPLKVKPFGGVLLGAQDGVNCTFTMTNNGLALGQAPIQAFVWKNFTLIVGIGYTNGPGVDQITFTTAPDPSDALFAQGSTYL